MRRSRLLYMTVIVAVVLLGLASRNYSRTLTPFLAEYAGDTLWALAVFLGIGTLFTRWTTLRVSMAALIFAVVVEAGQLYHASWIDQIRYTTIGGLILGYGFLWSDILCYCVGIGLGCIAELFLYRTNGQAAAEKHRI